MCSKHPACSHDQGLNDPCKLQLSLSEVSQPGDDHSGTWRTHITLCLHAWSLCIGRSCRSAEGSVRSHSRSLTADVWLVCCQKNQLVSGAMAISQDRFRNKQCRIGSTNAANIVTNRSRTRAETESDVQTAICIHAQHLHFKLLKCPLLPMQQDQYIDRLGKRLHNN